jgi:SAM-dependent methyltransferase
MGNQMDVKQEVQKHYAEAARTGSSCCGEGACGASQAVGYSPAELAAVPEGADLGLGCGNPTAFAQLKPGETVLDLGSGAGLDCFLAAQQVGPTGRVIGVDMTPEMLARARDNAEKVGAANVEFRQGEIESLPVEDASVDVVISNCVINLSPDKPRVFREIARALKPGGRMHVSDIVLNGELPEELKQLARAYTACIAGAWQKADYLKAIADAGLAEVTVERENFTAIEAHETDPIMRAVAPLLRNPDGSWRIVSIQVRAIRPSS